MNTDLLTQLLEERADHVSLRSGSLTAVRRRAARRTARTRFAVGAVGVAAVGGVAAAVRLPGDAGQRVTPLDTSVGVSTSTPATAPLTTAPVSTTSPLSAPLSKGITSTDVVTLEQSLVDLGYDPGTVDGVFDDSTEQAVWAFEGLTLGRPYDQQTGVVDATAWQALADSALVPRRPQSGTHVEVYLDTQVAVVFTNDEPTLVTHVSSGSGNTWCEELTLDTDANGAPFDPPIQRGICGVARTPGGVFQIFRMTEGRRQSSIGGMYNPAFFNYSIAIHGAVNVPSMPVSHGAIRIPMHIAEYFQSLVNVGDTVFVWDGLIEPEDQSIEDMLPTFEYLDPATSTTATTAG